MSGIIKNRIPFRSAASDAGRAAERITPAVLAQRLTPPARSGSGLRSQTSDAVKAAVEAERRGYGANWRSPIRSLLLSIGRYR